MNNIRGKYSMYCSVVAYMLVMNSSSIMLAIDNPIMILGLCIGVGILGGYIIASICYALEVKNKLQIQKEFLQITNIVLVMTLVLSLMGCAVGIGNIVNTPTQYEKDLNNAMDKTIDEMTPGEQKAFEDFLEWEIKEKGFDD